MERSQLQFQLAETLCAGANGVAADPVRAAHFYQLSADSGNAEAAYRLAECYCRGNGVTKNVRHALVWMRKARDAGHTEATFELAALGVVKGDSDSVEVLEKMAERGHIKAQVFLGSYLIHGCRKETARRFLKRAAEHGHPVAQFLCARDDDSPSTATWLEESAAAKFVPAMYLLAHRLVVDGTIADLQRVATMFLEIAPRIGDSLFTHPLGLFAVLKFSLPRENITINSMCGIAQQLRHDGATEEYQRQSFALVKIVHDWGCAFGTHELAHCYQNGIGVERDCEEALRLYVQAAESGVALAMILVAKEYLLREDLMVSARWFHTLLTLDIDDSNDPQLDRDPVVRTITTTTHAGILSTLQFLYASWRELVRQCAEKVASKTCVRCGVARAHKCGRCLLVRYCSEDCQRAHWPSHKPYCNVQLE